MRECSVLVVASGRIALGVITLCMVSACDRSSTPPNDAPLPALAPAQTPSQPEQAKQAVAPASGVSSGNPNVCEPIVFTDCPAGTSHPGVDETLAAAPTGVVTIVGVVEESDTRCTRSVPPSCMSSLALRDRPGGPGQRLVLAGQPGGTQYMCSESGGGPGCCTLATDGTRYAVTGTLANHASADTLTVDSVCRLP